MPGKRQRRQHPQACRVVSSSTHTLHCSRWRFCTRRFQMDRLFWTILPARRRAESCFRGKFTAGLKRLFRQHKLQFHGSLQSLVEPRCFRKFLRQFFREGWIVYAKPPFGSPEHVLTTLLAIRTASPSPTIDWLRFRMIESRFAGKTMRITASRRS